MIEDPKALLQEFALGTLSDDEMEAMQTLVNASPELQAELALLTETFTEAVGGLPPVEPSVDVRSRLMTAVRGPDRFLPFVDELCTAFDLAADRVRTLFSWIDEEGRWTPGPMPGIALVHFDGGPQAMAADTGWVRLASGLQFPMHRHHGREMNYILQGQIKFSDEPKIMGPGECVLKEPGSTHSFEVVSDEDVLLAVAQDGFEILP